MVVLCLVMLLYAGVSKQLRDMGTAEVRLGPCTRRHADWRTHNITLRLPSLTLPTCAPILTLTLIHTPHPHPHPGHYRLLLANALARRGPLRLHRLPNVAHLSLPHYLVQERG